MARIGHHNQHHHQLMFDGRRRLADNLAGKQATIMRQFAQSVAVIPMAAPAALSAPIESGRHLFFDSLRWFIDTAEDAWRVV